jgi:hypothetical protein
VPNLRRTKAERTEQQNNSRLEISGVLLLALGCFAAAAYFGLPTGTIGAFIDKVMNYTLGKGAFLFPLACIVLGIRFSFSHKGIGFSKKGLALTLLMLCLLGTAHHVFVPVGEELVPEQLRRWRSIGRSFSFSIKTSVRNSWSIDNFDCRYHLQRFINGEIVFKGFGRNSW